MFLLPTVVFSFGRFSSSFNCFRVSEHHQLVNVQSLVRWNLQMVISHRVPHPPNFQLTPDLFFRFQLASHPISQNLTFPLLTPPNFFPIPSLPSPATSPSAPLTIPPPTSAHTPIPQHPYSNLPLPLQALYMSSLVVPLCFSGRQKGKRPLEELVGEERELGKRSERIQRNGRKVVFWQDRNANFLDFGKKTEGLPDVPRRFKGNTVILP